MIRAVTFTERIQHLTRCRNRSARSGGGAAAFPVERVIGMLTDVQISQYRAQGYLTLPGVFTAAELEPVDAYLGANADVPWTDKNDDPLRGAHYHFRPLYQLCTAPRLVDAVEALLGGNKWQRVLPVRQVKNSADVII
jgi:hypothetical protein